MVDPVQGLPGFPNPVNYNGAADAVLLLLFVPAAGSSRSPGSASAVTPSPC